MDARLAIVLLTDEDDCSSEDPNLFDPALDATYGFVGLRCSTHPELLVPLDRFVGELLALQPDASRVSVVAIAGVPTDLVELNEAQLAATPIQSDQDFARILDDPRMQFQLDPLEPNSLLPSCDVPETGRAFPPRRIVETLRELNGSGAGAVVQSICQFDYTGAMQALARMVGRR